MSALTALVGVGLRYHLRKRHRLVGDHRHWLGGAARIQIAQLRELLQAAAPTEFGKAHDFARLSALPASEIVGAYRRAVPVRDWYGFKDMIARMRENGQPDVLWPGRVMDFAQTSGTTAGDKFIPVSAEMMRSNYRASLDIFCHLQRFGVSLAKLLAGKCLFLGGSTALSVNEHGIRTGDLSGLVAPLIKWPISTIYLPGRDIALMSNWPEKIEAMARRCVDEDVRMISGMPSWTLVLAERVLQLAREKGRTARGGGPITCLRDVWPNLMVFVHGGVKYTPFEPRVRQMFSGSATSDDIPWRHELYPASEAFVAMQDVRRDPGLRLNIDLGNFFEFVPLEEIGSPTPRACACWEVERGQRYVVVLSTCAGLWRYILGDVVEFDSYPPGLEGWGKGDGLARLRIVGRHRHFINAFGENLIVEHIENAVASAARAAGVTVGEFTAAPVYPGPERRAGLELAFEVAELSGAALRNFGATFDEALKSQNVDYTTKRSGDVGMAPPTLTPLAPGSIHRWMQARGKLGGQHKCPRCANDREIIEDLIRRAHAPGAGPSPSQAFAHQTSGGASGGASSGASGGA